MFDNQIDADNILKIYILRNNCEDKTAWNFLKKCQLTTKSANNIIMKNNLGEDFFFLLFVSEQYFENQNFHQEYLSFVINVFKRQLLLKRI